MKHNLYPFLIPLISMCAMPSLFGAQDPVTCAEHSISASAVRTPEDVKAFVQCGLRVCPGRGLRGGTQGL